MKINYNKGHWVFADFYGDTIKDENIAYNIGLSLNEYREAITVLKGKISKSKEDTYFVIKDDAREALEWINSVLIAEKLRG